MNAKNYELGDWLNQLLSVRIPDGKLDRDPYRIERSRSRSKAKLSLRHGIDDVAGEPILQGLCWSRSFSLPDTEIWVNTIDGIHHWTIWAGESDRGSNPQ